MKPSFLRLRARARTAALVSLLCSHCSSDEHQPTDFPAQDAGEFGPAIAQNPWTAANEFATQHGDTGASDSSRLAGPGKLPVAISKLDLFAVCPSILPLTSGLAFAVCTKIVNQTPTVYLFDPNAMTTLASRELSKGALLGGVYPYLDERERLIVIDGANDLLRISATGNALSVEQTIALGPTFTAHCGSPNCDAVIGLIADYDGRDWFASAHGLIGTVTRAGEIATFALPAGEQVANSIASAPTGVALVSDHALYLLVAAADGTPQVQLRAPYDRGSARKPGQLSWSSGTTPTYFGPRTGADYVAILDNARPTMNLLVYRSDGTAQPVCSIAVPTPAGDATEDSPIGAGRSVFITSTYGYVYPALPEGAGPSEPATAALAGGMARIDVSEDERSCALVWTNPVRSVALPKLSLADGWIYTIEQKLTPSGAEVPAYTVIDAATGALVAQQELPMLGDAMQLSPTIGPGQTLFQGTLTSIVRISPAPP